jgi:translation initiation factor 3 subunit J
MADNWDDSDDDDEWDKDSDDGEDVLAARLKKVGLGDDAPKFDDELDLAVVEKARLEKMATQELKKKGNALAEKKQAEQDRKDEEEIARKTMEMEAELEANMTPDELRIMKQRQIEEADNALTDDLFGGIDNKVTAAKTAAAGGAGGPLVLKDLKDHLKHARKVSAVIKVRL